MDRRKLTFKAKSTLTNINAKEKRELYNRQKRKDARQETIMSRRDIAKEEKENQKNSTTVKESGKLNFIQTLFCLHVNNLI